MASLFAGRILLEDRVVEGFVEVEGGKVVQAGQGDPPERPVATGWIVPSLVNAHTHVADTFLRDRPKPRGVAELVGPGGWKHKELAKARPGQMEDGARRYAREMADVGVSVFCDFREEGVPGTRMLRNLAPELPATPLVYGRPATYGFDEREAELLLKLCDGIGLSGLRDFRARDLEAWAEAARAARKPLAIHVSEDKRDPIDAALALEPAFVVHMVHATTDDLEECSQAGVAIVTCPRSNAYFGRRPPIQAMLDADCTLAVGTDNGMLQDGNLLAELALLESMAPDAGQETWLRAATHGGRAALKLPKSGMPKAGDPVDLVVLPDQPWAKAAAAKKPQLGVPEQETKPGA
ncbi:MAG TPA: amidohydrolase family protein [Candidatus Thermoplasmatota archaeon]|nr:amidohydrolase family protein [Candidatus Thermoplasmatota archaeon]